jgi:hypothetical protein
MLGTDSLRVPHIREVRFDAAAVIGARVTVRESIA